MAKISIHKKAKIEPQRSPELINLSKFENELSRYFQYVKKNKKKERIKIIDAICVALIVISEIVFIKKRLN